MSVRTILIQCFAFEALDNMHKCNELTMCKFAEKVNIRIKCAQNYCNNALKLVIFT